MHTMTSALDAGEWMTARLSSSPEPERLHGLFLETTTATSRYKIALRNILGEPFKAAEIAD